MVNSYKLKGRSCGSIVKQRLNILLTISINVLLKKKINKKNKQTKKLRTVMFFLFLKNSP